MTIRSWLAVMWAIEAFSFAGTLAAVLVGVRQGWPWFAVAGAAVAGVVVAELLLTVWRRWCPEPHKPKRAGDALRELVAGVRAVDWTGPGSAEWKSRRQRS